MTRAKPEAELATQFAHQAEPLFDVLSRRARRLTYNDADAEDLLQDTLLHAYAGFHTFEDGTNLKAWLLRILYHRWVSTHRVKERRPAEVCVDHVTERDLAVGAARLATASRSAEAEVLDAVPRSDVKAAMDTLPDRFRDVLYLADVEGHTYAETAVLLGIPMGTVMSRASRGRQRLRTALAHLAVDRNESVAAQQDRTTEEEPDVHEVRRRVGVGADRRRGGATAVHPAGRGGDDRRDRVPARQRGRAAPPSPERSRVRLHARRGDALRAGG
jgi:RNA polymerase sigma factor (sigma-70 family)